MERLKQLVSCNRGAAAVEFAIIGLVLIMVCVGGIEFGRGLWLRNELSFAADFAARKVLTDPAISSADLETELRSALTGIDPDLVEISFGSETVDTIEFRTVLVRYPLSLLVPGLSDDPITLSVNRRVPTGG